MTYFQCTNCEQIEPESNWVVEQGNKKCNHCGATDKYELWPSSEIRELFELIQTRNRESFEYGLVASVFISAALELLLERLLFSMAIENLLYYEAGHLVEALLDSNQGRERRLQLYNRLGYGSFEKETREVGCKNFSKHWDEIAKFRNKIVHGDLKEGTKISKSLVEATITESLAVFSKLNNIYNKESTRYKVATEPTKMLAKDIEKLKNGKTK
jgi:hypothetical protein